MFRVLSPTCHRHLLSAKRQTRLFPRRLSSAKCRAARPVGASSQASASDSNADRTQESAVASFFTPASQKPKERTTWTERAPDDDSLATLLVGRYEPEQAEDTTKVRRKIAAFDLDSTLITTASGKTHANSATDWKWWSNQVPGRLRQMYEEEGYRVVILSNQAGLTLHFDANHKGPKAGAQKRVSDFKLKCNGVLNQLNLPTTIYAATAKDLYRKPRVGMWKELCEDYDIPEDEIDLGASIFVGDAGGRVASVANPSTGAVAAKKDFSCSDRNFAHNVGIEYKTPEEFFLGEKPREFIRDFDLASFSFVEDGAAAEQEVFEKANKQDIVLFCGPPGAGKSTFFWTHLQPLGYQRINQDILKSRDRCVKVAQEYLQDGESVAIDNTNADADTRAIWVELARKAKVPIRCVWFKTPIHVAQHNDAVRSQNKVLNREGRSGLPPMAFSGFASRHKEPRLEEGFQDIVEMPFEFKGTKEEYEIWARYW